MADEAVGWREPRRRGAASRDVVRAARTLGRRAAQYGSEIARGIRPAYGLARGLSAALPLFTGTTLRAHLYRLAGFQVGRGCAMFGPLEIISGAAGIEQRLILGKNVIISTHVIINVDDVVRIEDNVGIGPCVTIYTGNHPIGPDSRRMMPEVVGKPVTIERGAWIRLGALILPGVTVGRGSIVGAGSVVTADVPPNSYVEGNPARVVRALPPGRPPRRPARTTHAGDT